MHKPLPGPLLAQVRKAGTGWSPKSGAPEQVTENRADSEVSEATLEGLGELEKEELLCL